MNQTLIGHRNVFVIATFVLASGVSLGSFADQVVPPERRSTRVTEEIRRLVEAEPTQTLDPRIDVGRITELPAVETPDLML